MLNLHPKTIVANLSKLICLNWISENSKTNYYIFHSFDRIRKVYNWVSRASIELYASDIFHIRAFLGAAIYGYLHKDFWRKVKRDKSVQIREYTYHFISATFNYKIVAAPISVIGVANLFGIQQSKASRIKTLAAKEKFIEVTKRYRKLHISKDEAVFLKGINYLESQNIVFNNGNYYLQEIDHIIPLFNIRKRKKIET